MEHTLWRVWYQDSVVELYAFTKTEALIRGGELLNRLPVELSVIRIYD